MNPLIQNKKATPLFLVALVCLELLPSGRAVNPPPDGGYAGQNTAERTDALLNLTMGTNNTAAGRGALYTNLGGSSNIATGFRAPYQNLGGATT